MKELLGQAITDGGAISANWILVAVTSIAGFLFWTQLREIKVSLQKAIEKLGEHDTDIEVLKSQQNNHVDNLERIDKHGKEQFEKIMDKLDAITPK